MNAPSESAAKQFQEIADKAFPHLAGCHAPICLCNGTIVAVRIAYRNGYEDAAATSSKATLAADRWISVEEDLPKHDEWVMIAFRNFRKSHTVSIGIFYNPPHEKEPCFYHGEDDLDVGETGVTHWQPLPEPPQRNSGAIAPSSGEAD